MIDIKKLAEKDIGKTVFYKPTIGNIEDGILKSWNDTYIFVVYPNGNDAKRNHFDRYTAAATSPKDLFWENPANTKEEIDG